METQEIIFKLILHSGNGKSFAMEALAAAKQGEIVQARVLLGQAVEELQEAHIVQTSLIQNEAGGELTTLSLLLIHAQDHLMNAITVKDLASEFIDLYEKINAQGGVHL